MQHARTAQSSWAHSFLDRQSGRVYSTWRAALRQAATFTSTLYSKIVLQVKTKDKMQDPRSPPHWSRTKESLQTTDVAPRPDLLAAFGSSSGVEATAITHPAATCTSKMIPMSDSSKERCNI